MKVSIIVPVHNTGSYLVDCVDSITNQSYSDLEIICVDDDSDDAETIDIIGRISKEERIIVLRQERRVGAAGARNIGFEKAPGDYVVFWDSDG